MYFALVLCVCMYYVHTLPENRENFVPLVDERNREVQYHRLPSRSVRFPVENVETMNRQSPRLIGPLQKFFPLLSERNSTIETKIYVYV